MSGGNLSGVVTITPAKVSTLSLTSDGDRPRPPTLIPRFDDEPLADRGGRSAIKVPQNRRPEPFAPGHGRAREFGLPPCD